MSLSETLDRSLRCLLTCMQLDDRATWGVPPLRGVGLLRCASGHRPASRPLTGGYPSRGLAGTPRARSRAVCRRTAAWSALPVRSPMQRSRLRLHRRGEQPSQAGGAGVDDDSGPFPCPWSAGLVSFTLRVNDARLTN